MEVQKIEWRNECTEAWRLSDGRLVVKRRVDKPMEDGHDHYYVVSTLEPIKAKVSG